MKLASLFTLVLCLAPVAYAVAEGPPLAYSQIRVVPEGTEAVTAQVLVLGQNDSAPLEPQTLTAPIELDLASSTRAVVIRITHGSASIQVFRPGGEPAVVGGARGGTHLIVTTLGKPLHALVSSF